MSQPTESLIQTAGEAFAAKAKWLREKRELSQTDLEREMKKRGKSVVQKTVSNIERSIHDSQLSNYAAIAEHFGVPLWVMFVPGLTTDLLEGDKLKRLVKMVQDYLACDDTQRDYAEKMLAGHAALNIKK